MQLQYGTNYCKITFFLWKMQQILPQSWEKMLWDAFVGAISGGATMKREQYLVMVLSPPSHTALYPIMAHTSLAINMIMAWVMIKIVWTRIIILMNIMMLVIWGTSWSHGVEWSLKCANTTLPCLKTSCYVSKYLAMSQNILPSLKISCHISKYLALSQNILTGLKISCK